MALLNDMLLPLTPTKKASGSSKVDGRPSESFDLQTGRVIVASSRAVYGEAGLDQFGVPMPSKEGDATNPKSVYAVTKLAQENLLFAGFQGLQKCAVRFQNVYGEGQALTNPYTGVASAFVAAALDGRDINVYSDGQMTRDFVHVQDAVRALSMCIESELPPPEILNVGTGRATTILQLAEAIVQLSGSQSEIKVLGGELLGDVRNNYADTSRARAFGFQAETDLHQGLLSLIEWAKSADRTDSNLLYRRAQNEMLANGVLR
jgi:dTDP-L-rhamnose 4-epimerase